MVVGVVGYKQIKKVEVNSLKFKLFILIEYLISYKNGRTFFIESKGLLSRLISNIIKELQVKYKDLKLKKIQNCYDIIKCSDYCIFYHANTKNDSIENSINYASILNKSIYNLN